MAMYHAKKRIKVITQNETVYDTDFSGWMAVNNGDEDVIIDKVKVAPGKGLDYTDMHPDVVWDSPIQIVFPAGSGEVVLTQIIYKKTEK